jgi:murein DD-endopeptidase MepM/ murein hydrolase activator NlpD
MPGAPMIVGMRRRRLALPVLLLLVVTWGSSSAAAAAPLMPPMSRSAESATAKGWAWPVSGQRLVLRPFLAPPTPYAAGHRGVDLAAVAVGDEVLAATSGVVHFAGRVVDRGVVTIRSGQLLVTVEPVTPTVSEGDAVVAGSVIGTLEAGHCASPCVHVGVREAGAYVSPLRWLGGLRRAVLLPLDG